MPATTSGYKLPYPLGTDRLMDGDDQIRKLAQSVENMVQTGTVNITPSAVDTTTTVTVTFPVAFSAAPLVFCNFNSPPGSGYTLLVWSSSPTTTNVAINIRKGTTTASNVNWVAIGPVVAVA